MPPLLYQHRSPYDLPAFKPLKPPIYNPYDKFSQPEFDAWIGDLTDALKGALGRLNDGGKQSVSTGPDPGNTPVATECIAEGTVDEGNMGNEVEDSFADIKARRVIRKGKARDPREGPGFGIGMGDSHQPIEIGSDSEEAEEDGESETGLQQWDMDEEDEEEEEEEEDEEDEDQSWLQGESSTQARIRGEGDLYEYEDRDENEEFYDQDEKDDAEYEVFARPRERGAAEVVLPSSDEETEGDEAQGRGFVGLDDFDGHSHRSAEEGTAAISHSIPNVVNNADEFESDGLCGELGYPEVAHKVTTTGDGSAEDAQPTDENSSFPSPTVLPAVFQQPVEMPDPWSGPKTYAEDFYSGGDVRAAPDVRMNVDHLGVCDDEGDVSTSHPITPVGNDPPPGVNAAELSVTVDVEDFDRYEERNSEEQVIAEDDVLKSHSSLVSLRDAQDIEISKLYGDMEVDVRLYQQEEIDLSTTEAPHAAEVSDHVASFMVDLSAPLEMQAQKEGPFELESCPVVEEPLKVEMVEVQEPIAGGVDNITSLTHGSDLVRDRTDSPSLVGVDWENVEGISSSSSQETSSPVNTQPSVWSSSELPRLSRIFGGLLTPEHDHSPSTTLDEGQVASGSSSSNEPELEPSQHLESKSSAGIAEHQSHPTIETTTELMAKSATARVQDDGESSPNGLLDDAQSPSAATDESLTSTREPETTSGRYSSSPTEEPLLTSQAFAAIDVLPVNFNAVDSSGPVETLQSDMHVSAFVNTNSVAESSQEFTVCEEPSLDSVAPEAVSEPLHDAVATPTVADVTDQLPASPIPSQAEFSIGLARASTVPEGPKAQAQTSPSDQISDEASLLMRMDPVSPGMSDRAPFGNEIATDHPEISHATVHNPASLSSVHTLSPSVPSSSYPPRMVMRKATDPVLFVDPYPYSLSTPGQTQDEASEDEETEQENSLSSSSTFDKYSDDKVKESDAITASNEGAQDTEFQSSSETLEVDDSGSIDTLLRAGSMESSVPEQNDVDSDTDADGDVDPEFIVVGRMPSSARSSSTNGLGGVVEDSSRDADVKNPPSQGEEKSLTGVQAHHELASEQQNSHAATSAMAPTISRSANELPAIIIVKKRKNPSVIIKPNDSGSAEAEHSHSSDHLPDTRTLAYRSSKRKRDLPSDLLTGRLVKPLPVSYKNRKSLQAQEAQPVKPHQSKRKGKNSQSGSGNTSRASSIASSAPSDKSSQGMYMHSSPTIDKGLALRHQMPPPLLHTHLRTIPHHHGLPSAQFQRSIQKSHSIPRQSDSRSTAMSSSFHSGPSRRSSLTSSSPVTRSHCRYHKISIPRYDDDGPREYFLVPGCSLGNRELIAEELIEDHGDATPEDADRSVNDIVSLESLNPYLVGIMRQLVGLDRDQEVYYVPPEGQEPVRKRRYHKAPFDKLTLLRPGHDSTNNGTSASPRVSFPNFRSRAPLSASGSVSTSASFPRQEMEFDPLSALSPTESDLSDEDSPRLKRARPSLPEDIVPAAATGSVSFEEPKTPRKKEPKKRTRTTTLGELDVEHPKLKKQKMHTNDKTVETIPPSGIHM